MEGHLAMAYPYMICTVCGEKGHGVHECNKEWKCNLCGQSGQVFCTCLRSFAITVKGRQGGESMAGKSGQGEGREEL